MKPSSCLPLVAILFSTTPVEARDEDVNRFVSEAVYLKTPHQQSTENFGQGVAISGNTAVVAALGGGVIHVFENRAGVWTHHAHLSTGEESYTDVARVAISGDIIVVGAPLDDSAATGVNGNDDDHSAIAAGAAYIFERGAGGWRKTAYLKASNTKAFDRFGSSVAVSGNTVIVGADNEGAIPISTPPHLSSAGAAYVFSKSGGLWSEQAYLKPSDAASVGFGYSVAISGDTVIVGAIDLAFLTSPGSAFVFSRGPGGWQEQAHLKGANAGGFDGFGFSVGASADTLVVGAAFGDRGSGAAHVFARGPGGWQRQARLKASNATQQDFFGKTVAISGDTIVVGAPFESSAATGIDGIEANNGAENSGASYIFRRRDDRWSQLAYVKASNAEEGDQFGCSVSISGGHVVVGALRDGHKEDFNQIAPGAAYIFRVLPPRGELAIVRSPNPFEPTRIGSRTREKTLILLNSGTETIRGLRLRLPGTAGRDFLIRSRAARTLEPGRTTRIEVAFRPTRPGLRRATLKISGQFPTKGVTLSGKGLPQAPRFPGF
jgi:hypothetical protein